jgi:hypothetical protein
MLKETFVFIFSSFWTFAGTAFLIGITGHALKTAFKGLRGFVRITFKNN